MFKKYTHTLRQILLEGKNSKSMEDYVNSEEYLAQQLHNNPGLSDTSQDMLTKLISAEKFNKVRTLNKALQTDTNPYSGIKAAAWDMNPYASKYVQNHFHPGEILSDDDEVKMLPLRNPDFQSQMIDHAQDLSDSFPKEYHGKGMIQSDGKLDKNAFKDYISNALYHAHAESEHHDPKIRKSYRNLFNKAFQNSDIRSLASHYRRSAVPDPGVNNKHQDSYQLLDQNSIQHLIKKTTKLNDPSFTRVFAHNIGASIAKQHLDKNPTLLSDYIRRGGKNQYGDNNFSNSYETVRFDPEHTYQILKTIPEKDKKQYIKKYKHLSPAIAHMFIHSNLPNGIDDTKTLKDIIPRENKAFIENPILQKEDLQKMIDATKAAKYKAEKILHYISNNFGTDIYNKDEDYAKTQALVNHYKSNISAFENHPNYK